ncbi:hypothetical protein DFH09DRAFT_267286 [Mycena vulgaris]|nr:hypothetical protein DFH09DRAFT_267286 [Mycena vulgaris]
MGIGFKPDVEVSGLIRNYDGPYHLLRFLHLAPSSHLHITDLNFPDFISELGAIQRLDNVTSLVLDIEDYVTNLDGLGKSFPTLKELKICVEIGYQLDSFETIDKSKVLDSLKQLTRFSSFPLYLAKLEISWSGRDPSYARETNIIKPDDLRQLKDVLVLRHSALERLRLDCVDYTLFWGRTSEDGTECCMVYDPHDSSNLNVLYSDEFWDTYC